MALKVVNMVQVSGQAAGLPGLKNIIILPYW